MNSEFWSNTIWYLLLFITSIISVGLILYKTNNLKFALAFLFSIIGFSFIIEAFLVIGFNAYAYYPKIVPNSYLDIIFGNYFSQMSISSTALMLAVYNLSAIWYCFFAVIYFFIDMLFVKLGIYQHFWYKSIYTFLGFIAFSWIIRKWYEQAKDSTHRWINYSSLYLSVASISTFTVFLPQRLLGIQLLKGHIIADISKDNTTTGFVYQFIVINFLISLYRSKLPWVVKAIAISCLYVAQYLVCRAGYIYSPNELFFTVTSWDILGCYGWIAVFNYLLSSQEMTPDHA